MTIRQEYELHQANDKLLDAWMAERAAKRAWMAVAVAALGLCAYLTLLLVIAAALR